jgi:predicted O-methyltransferase YrrM
MLGGDLRPGLTIDRRPEEAVSAPKESRKGLVMIPEPEFDALLRQLEQQGSAHDAAQSEHRRKRLNLETPTARLLQLLILAGGRRRVLEIGTSNGYSALWIADALRRIPGATPLTTIERDPGRADEARQNLSRAGLATWTDIRVGEASAIVGELKGSFDAVFFDADRVSAPEQLLLLLPKLEADVLLVADNALSHPEEVAPYIEAVGRIHSFLSLIVPIGKGLHIAHRLQA